MAEFHEVIEQWLRRCEVCDMDGETECKLNGFVCAGFLKMRKYIDPDTVEKDVMSWAAEHPEPVYPTWKEWLEEQRVVVHFDSVSEKGTKVKWELTNKSNCHIPADIAEKLGIEPKEG